MTDAPLIDSRTASDIETEVRELLLRSIREDAQWPGQPPADVARRGALAALIGVFGRFTETAIDRLNRSPKKNFLAYLDLLGVSRLPPRPARVPLTFGLATGATQSVIVRAGTQVAAQPAKNEKQPTVFETDRELVVSPARLLAAYMMDHGRDRYFSWLPPSPAQLDALDSQGVSPVQHILYLAFGEVLAVPVNSEMELHITLEKPVPGKRVIVWEINAAAGWTALLPTQDETDNLSRSGAIRFTTPATVPATVNGRQSRWIRGRLTTPIEGDAGIPVVCAIGIQASAEKADLANTVAFLESQPLDLTRDFFPLGARPAFGSTFFLGNAEALSTADGEITIHLELTNPATGGPEPPVPRTTAAGRPQLAWETWNGTRWVTFGLSQTAEPTTESWPQFEDHTLAFTQSGDVTFRLPEPARPLALNGTTLPWIRVRLISGDYGTELAPLPAPPPGERHLNRAPLSPPCIRSLALSYRISRTADRPEIILDWNDFKWTDQSATDHTAADHTATEHTATRGCFAPFRSDKNLPRALYFGFQPPEGRRHHPFANRSLSLYVLATGTSAETIDTPPSAEWEYWNGTEWKKWTVRDETTALTDSGAVRFLPPPDFTRRVLFDQNVYWLRARWPETGFPGAPVRRILMNTVTATSAETIANEILGSGNGTPAQSFRTMRSPVLDGPVVEVREPQRPSEFERALIERDEGADAVRIVRDESGADREIWVRWHEMPDYLESGPFDRHYVMDHLTGEIRFGDNIRGMIPPAGSGNILASSYRTGGGAAGNRKPGEIISLKTAVPYVDRVYNYEPAEGGVDAEDERELPVRGARIVRHRNRAVTVTDYEDLAMLASPEVARARCVPVRDLVNHPDADVVQPGEVSVMIVPRTTDARPSPSPTLLDIVRDYLNERKVPSAELHISGPDYVRVEVEVEIGLESDTGDVELAVATELGKYLHPLTGGPQNTGWQFGRRVRASELYKVIEPVPGVRYISRLEVTEREEPRGGKLTDTFLIYSGVHKIRLFLPED